SSRVELAAGRLVLSGLAVVNGQRANRPGTHFAGHARAELRVHDLPREKKIHRRHKKARVLDKEWPLFWKEDREALIDRDLWVVGLHLAEIWVEGHVKRKRIIGDKLGVNPRAMFEHILVGRIRPIRWLIQEMIPGQQTIGNELNVAPGR